MIQKTALIAGLILFCSTSSFATMTLVKYPTDFFTVVPAPSPLGAPTIYAGMTSSNGACSGALCDSCAGLNADFTASTGSTTAPTSGQYTTCSVREIHPADLFTVTVSSTYSGGVPNAPLYIQSGLTVTPTQITGAPLFNGSSATFSIPWSEICLVLGNDANCTTSFPATSLNIGWGQAGAALTEFTTIQIAFRYVSQSPGWTDWCGPTFNGSFSSAYQGFCYFTAAPEDGGALIAPTANTQNSFLVSDLQCAGGACDVTSADPSSTTYSGFAVFYSTSTQFTTSTPHQVINPWKVSATHHVVGLTNGTPYYFAIASVDQAGILTHFSNPANEDFVLGSPSTDDSQAVIPGGVQDLLNVRFH